MDAAQEMDDRREHRQVDEDLQPQTAMGAAPGTPGRGMIPAVSRHAEHRQVTGIGQGQHAGDAQRPDGLKLNTVVREPRAGHASRQRQGEHAATTSHRNLQNHTAWCSRSGPSTADHDHDRDHGYMVPDTVPDTVPDGDSSGAWATRGRS